MEELLCPCKVNIVLRVLDKREDGYHNILSIFLPMPNPNDKLCIMKAEGKGLRLNCNIKELEHDNVLQKAYFLFGQTTGLWPGLEVYLEKNIPVGSGLGGGSSNCANFLKFLGNNYLDSEEKDRILLDIARRCGADVPFFLKPRPAIVGGVGDIIEEISLDLQEHYIIILCPELSISTKWAYTELDKKRETHLPCSLTINAFKINKLSCFSWNFWVNDFEGVVFKKYPELAKIKSDCFRLGARACVLSGSGASLVALFRESCSLDGIVNFFKGKAIKIFVNKGV